MKWNILNIVGLVLILTVAFRFYKEGTSYIATTGNTAAQLYSVTSLNPAVTNTQPAIVK